MGTDRKAAIGVASALRDLTLKGFYVSLPASEHCPFDLVVSKGGAHKSVQVRYRALTKAGALSVSFDGSWSNTRGTHKRRLNKALVDIVCVYCPEVDTCYYLDTQLFGVSATFQVSGTKGRAKHHADNYLDVPGFDNAVEFHGASRTTKKKVSPTTALKPVQCAWCRSWFKPREARVRHCSTVCSSRASRRARRPTEAQLAKLVWKKPLSHLAKEYEVSDVTISTWCKDAKVDTPPVGYWQKKRSTSQRPKKSELKKLVADRPMYKVAQHYGVGQKRVRLWCRELGISTPPPGHWIKRSITE